MANHPIHNPKDYSETLRKLETTDPGHPNTFNPLFERLLNNEAFISSLLATHMAAAAPHPPQTTLNLGSFRLVYNSVTNSLDIEVV